MADKNTRFRKIVDRFKEGLAATGAPATPAPDERFVMKPGEVRIVRRGRADGR
jgi:hypothetical protein